MDSDKCDSCRDEDRLLFVLKKRVAQTSVAVPCSSAIVYFVAGTSGLDYSNPVQSRAEHDI